MPLGIDATLRYGLGVQGTASLTEADLRNQTAYYTSIHTGLPPTPIGNAGLASLHAAAHSAAVDYLYYLRQPDLATTHFFTASEPEFCAEDGRVRIPPLLTAKMRAPGGVAQLVRASDS